MRDGPAPTMRRDALFLACLGSVLLACGVFVALGSGSQVIEGVNAAEPDQASEVPGSTLVATHVGPTDPDDREAAAPGAATVGGGRETVETEQSAALRPGPIISVVRGSPPAPVPAASVHFVDRATAQQRHRQSSRPWVHEMDLPFVHGATVQTGNDGKVRLPSVTELLIVSVLHEGTFATASLDRRHKDEVTLRLRKDETLRVLVQSQGDKPCAGVPIVLYQGETFGKTQQIWAAPTGADGFAVAAHFQEFRQNRGPNDVKSRYCAAVRVPLATPVAAEFQGNPAPSEPVRLLLPGTGRVEVTLTDRAGLPLLSEATISLAVVRPEGFKLDLPLDAGFDALRGRKTLGEEPVVFERVGLGIQLRPNCRMDQDPRSFRGPDVTSPAQAFEVVRVRLQLPDDWAVLLGSVQDSSGAVAANLQLSFDLARGAQSTRAGSVTTLADGRFDLAVRLERALSPASLELRRPQSEDPWQGIRVDLGGLSPGERRDLGTLRLQSLPLLASGVCVDDTGQPLIGADVRVQLAGGPQPGREGRGESWNDTPLGQSSTGEDGRFNIFGPRPPFPLRLRASFRDHFAETSPPVGHGAEVRLVLQRAGKLAGTAVLPEWLPAESATLRLVQQHAQQGASKLTRETTLQADRGGRFRVENLRPGSYDAVVTVRNLPEPVLQFETVMIAPGDNQDARLQPVDLRSCLFRYRLQATGPSGPLPVTGPVLARMQKPDGSNAEVGFRMQNGAAEMITQSSMMTLLVFARGYPPTQLTVVPGDHTVFMQPLHPAYVRMPGLRALCGPERRVRVSMIFAGKTSLPEGLNGTDHRSGESFSFPRWEMSRSGGGWLDNTDTAEVILSRNGPHDAVLRIYEDATEQGSQSAVGVGKLDVVLDGAGPNTYTLSFDAARVAAAVQEAEQRRLQRLQQGQQNEGRPRIR